MLTAQYSQVKSNLPGTHDEVARTPMGRDVVDHQGCTDVSATFRQKMGNQSRSQSPPAVYMPGFSQ